MKKHLLFFLLILLNLHPVKSQDKNNVPGELLVMLNPAASPYKMQSDLSVLKDKNTRLNITRTLSASMHIYLMTFDHLSIHEDLMLNAVRSYPGVQIAQFNHYVNERNTVPNDPQFGVMWGMENTGTNGGAGAVADADIDATTAWDVTTGGLTSAGDTIVVAVIDGGFSLTHPDLIDNYWRNYDEIPDNGVDDDLNGYIDDFNGWHSSSNSDNFPSQSHGTHVAGTIGAKGNNGIGVTGVNWNVKIMPISYGSGSGSFESNVVEAYAFARDQRREYDLSNGTKGAFVVATNSSFGVDLASPSSYPLWCAMYDSLGVLGILSAGATANANYDVDAQGDIPTACPSDWLITVTNLKSNDTKANAGFGASMIDLGAPGTNITSTYYSTSSGSNNYNSSSGTSMATPHVAGTIGLLFSVPCPHFILNYKADPAGMALIIKDSILGSTDPVAALDGITLTGGRLNLNKAVKSIQNYCAATSVSEISHNSNQSGISRVYPNPADQSVFVELNADQNSNLIITNVLGQEIKKIEVKAADKMIINISELEKGVYLFSLENSPGRAVKLIVH